MYIDIIDNFVDQLLEDFYINVISKDKLFNKIYDEQNFVKFQKEINEILVKYFKSIDFKEIKNFVNKEDTFDIIVNVFKKYLCFYLFTYIARFYKFKEDTLINNIVEFSKYQVNYDFKISEFFNSESNSTIFYLHNIVKNILKYISFDKEKDAETFINKIEQKDTKKFIDSISNEFVDKFLKKAKEEEKTHIIIKTLILLNIYNEKDKKEISNVIEVLDDEGETIWIDIVIPQKQVIDFSTVENVLSRKEIQQGFAEDFWNYIISHDPKNKKFDDTIENKLLKLINSKILIPITDEFLLYHKDSEKYTYDDSVEPKKKEDTKIRYIVNKIDKAADFYSKKIEDKEQLRKIFFGPLLPRKAVVYNNLEDVKIINKLLNQGENAIKNNEYINDLLVYRNYAYNNFKDFKDNGFTLLFNKTIDAIRSVSFEKQGDFRQNSKSLLQMRVGSNKMYVNVVGFMIPSNKSYSNCLRVNEVTNINKLGKNEYDTTIEFLNKYKFSNIEDANFNQSVFWLFKDAVEEKSNKEEILFDKQNIIKNLIGKFYDDIVFNIYQNILLTIDKKDKITLQKAMFIKEYFENKFTKIDDPELLNNLNEKIYYEKVIKTTGDYDIKDDEFKGLDGSVIKLQEIKKFKEEDIKSVKLNIHQVERVIEEKEEIDAVCQHNISWSYLNELRRTDPNKHTDLLYEFIQQYVIENIDGEMICKSCSTHIDIKKFLIDGTFDDQTNQFVAYSISMSYDMPLEETKEYYKYRGTIRNVDKLIEKIASIANIPYFIGTTSTIKSRRKNIVKDLIDILEINNINLKKNYKQRNELSSKTYNISRNLSEIFVFELEDAIFTVTSKEKDFYKNIKHNNIVAYLIICLFLEISESNITFMSGDKKGICNYPIFTKYGHNLFDNLKVRVNRGGDVDDIKNYKVLCYMIYIISCMITKYNIWYFESKDEKESKVDKKKFKPIVQKIIIHTVLDVLNSILEYADLKKGKSNIYEIISTKYYSKLTTIFNKQEILDKFDIGDKSSLAIDRKTYVLTKSEPMKLTGKFKVNETFIDSNYYTCRIPKLKMSKRNLKVETYDDKNMITNCPTGDFHQWKSIDKKELTCEKCKLVLSQIKYEKNNNDEFIKKYHYFVLKQIAQKFCLTGIKHNYYIDKEKNIGICKICSKAEDYDYNNKELDTLEANILKNTNLDFVKKIKTSSSEEEEKRTNYEEKLEKNYKENIDKDEQYKFINKFIKEIKNIVGESNLENVYLDDNTYFIDHDYDGSILKKPIIIKEKENKIQFRSNHPFYKTDVIYYTTYKNGKIDVYYDAITKIHLGYKDSIKDYVRTYRTDNRLVINYSMKNKLILLGYDEKYVNLQKYIKTLDLEITDNEKENDEILVDVYYDIIRKRITNLKKIIYNTQIIINRVKYAFINQKKKKKEVSEDEEMKEEEIEEDTTTDEIVEKYIKKISELNITNVFNNWKDITDDIFVLRDEITKYNLNTKINDNIIDIDKINKFETKGNSLLFYIIKELSTLIDNHQNKSVKVNVCMLLIEIINYLFKLYNKEYENNNIEFKRFDYLLHSIAFASDMENVISALELVDDNGEFKEEKAEVDKDAEKEQNEDDEEAENAMDFGEDADDMEENAESRFEDFNQD